jgi:hypothetical protein
MSLAEIMATFNADVMPTTEEITAWNALNPVVIAAGGGGVRLMAGRLLVADADDTVTTKVGLFGADLTTFNEDCVAAEDTDICDPADYVDFNGWGIGVHWSDSEDTTANIYNVVIFEEPLIAVLVGWSADENSVGLALPDSVASDTPAALEDFTIAVDATDAFAGWAGAELTTNEDDQFAFSFFEALDEDWYFEDGDTTTLWTSVLDGASDNVKTADFVLVGAASLTAATSVVVAALLF